MHFQLQAYSLNGVGDVGQVLDSLDDAGFQNYLKNDPQAQKDLDSLAAALKVVSSQGSGTAQAVITNGMTSQEVINAINSILGK